MFLKNVFFVKYLFLATLMTYLCKRAVCLVFPTCSQPLFNFTQLCTSLPCWCFPILAFSFFLCSNFLLNWFGHVLRLLPWALTDKKVNSKTFSVNDLFCCALLDLSTFNIFEDSRIWIHSTHLFCFLWEIRTYVHWRQKPSKKVKKTATFGACFIFINLKKKSSTTHYLVYLFLSSVH